MNPQDPGQPDPGLPDPGLPDHGRPDPPGDAQRLRGAFHALIRRFGLLETAHTPCGQPIPVSQAHTLMELLHTPELRQGRLANALGLSKSATSRMVAQLEGRGWVERRKDAQDARVRRLLLTPSGRRLAQTIDAASLHRFSAMLGGIPTSRQTDVIAALQALHRAVPTPVEESPVDEARGFEEGPR